MAHSRLERFQASVKNDLDSLHDSPKGKPADSEDQSSGVELQEHLDQQADDAIEGFDELDIESDDSSDSDDSESGCLIEIVPALDDNPQKTSVEKVAETTDFALRPKMQLGQAADAGDVFCPLLAVSKFPYKFVPKADMQPIATTFFDGGKFWNRQWDLFYIWSLEDSAKPIIFIRYEQFDLLLKEIGARFKTVYVDASDQYYRRLKLVVDSFPDHPRLIPRYLGRSSSRDEHEDLVRRSPRQSPFSYFSPAGAKRALTTKESTMFNKICEAAIDLGRNKSRGLANPRAEQRAITQRNLAQQLKRAQRYLGLRKNLLEREAMKTKEDVSMTTDPLQVPSFPCEDDVVIICIDIEAWERNSSVITEIGVATLDTRDLRNAAPGCKGEGWQKLIRARHFRIQEHVGYQNHDFVQGHPDNFEFGQSEWLSLKDATRTLAACFKEPFSKKTTKEDIAGSWENSSSRSSELEEEKETAKRNIIFLGHNPAADIAYLRKLNYEPTKLSNVLETFDTAELYRLHKGEVNLRGVGGILAEYGMTGWFLHNAGNDAVYTMWIFLATCVGQAMKNDADAGGVGDKSGEDTIFVE